MPTIRERIVEALHTEDEAEFFEAGAKALRRKRKAREKHWPEPDLTGAADGLEDSAKWMRGIPEMVEKALDAAAEFHSAEAGVRALEE